MSLKVKILQDLDIIRDEFSDYQKYCDLLDLVSSYLTSLPDVKYDYFDVVKTKIRDSYFSCHLCDDSAPQNLIFSFSNQTESGFVKIALTFDIDDFSKIYVCISTDIKNTKRLLRNMDDVCFEVYNTKNDDITFFDKNMELFDFVNKKLLDCLNI